MNAFDIVLIILCVGVCGWIPIYFFFDGIVKVIRAFKGLDDNGYDRNGYDRKRMNIAPNAEEDNG